MVAIAERIIENNDKPRAEVVIDVEILEVNRTRVKQYGLNLSNYQIGLQFSPEGAAGGVRHAGTTTATSHRPVQPEHDRRTGSTRPTSTRRCRRRS